MEVTMDIIGVMVVMVTVGITLVEVASCMGRLEQWVV
jgi:hypothetical protein